MTYEKYKGEITMTAITEDYVSFETAKLLKKKKFNELCTTLYAPYIIYKGKRISAKKESLLIRDGCGDMIEYIEGKDIWEMTHENSDNGEMEYSRPTLQMAMKWLRLKHNIDIDIDAEVGMLGVKVYVPMISTYKSETDNPSELRQYKRGLYYKDDKGFVPALQDFETYEEACEAAIKYCLENLI